MKRGNKILKEFGELETKHKIISLILIIIITIVITRFLTFFNDPTIIIKGYELHHFYYGVLLLVIVVILKIFNKIKFPYFLTLSGISIGLISDEFLFIMKKLPNSEYLTAWQPALIFTILIIMIILIIRYKISK